MNDIQQQDYTNLFKYYDGLDRLPPGGFKISPSSVSDFFDNKFDWYNENLSGAPKRFTGNNGSIGGTCVHAAAEVVANSLITGIPYDNDQLVNAIEDYIESTGSDPSINVNLISSLWKPMAEQLIDAFVIKANTIATEQYLSHEIAPGVFVGGTYDAITSTEPNDDLYNPKGSLTVRDYKTAKTKPSTFSKKYTLQAYCYAYMLAQQGIKISEVELCFVVQATQTLPIRTVRMVKPFDDYAYNKIEAILKHIAEAVTTWKEYPDTRHLLSDTYTR